MIVDKVKKAEPLTMYIKNRQTLLNLRILARIKFCT